MNELVVLDQAANDRVLVHEVEDLLLGRRVSLENLPDGPQPVRSVRESHRAGMIHIFPGMAVGELAQSLQNAYAFNAAGLEHRLGPAHRPGADAAQLAEQPGGAALTAADLLGGDVYALRAEAAR